VNRLVSAMPARSRRWLVDAIGGGWMMIGAGLIADPARTMRIAGIPVDDQRSRAMSRLLGLRDMALGAAVISSADGATRKRVLRGVAVMDFAEVLLLWLPVTRFPAGARMRLTLAAGLNGLMAAAGTLVQDEMTPLGQRLLAAGYLLAAAPALKLPTVLNREDSRLFAAFEAGAALVALGWLRRGNRVAALTAAGTAAAVGAVWSARRPVGATEVPQNL
jgi:hypothetical protein